MGTLFNQRPREECARLHIDNVLRQIAYIIDKPLDKLNVEELRVGVEVVRLAHAVQGADALDEQLAGFGQILKDFLDREE
jgi:hypothetical protein